MHWGGTGAVPEPFCREVGQRGAAVWELLEGDHIVGGKRMDWVGGAAGQHCLVQPYCPGSVPASPTGFCFPGLFPASWISFHFPRLVSPSQDQLLLSGLVPASPDQFPFFMDWFLFPGPVSIFQTGFCFPNRIHFPELFTVSWTGFHFLGPISASQPGFLFPFQFHFPVFSGHFG